jgi:hypothetical protein
MSLYFIKILSRSRNIIVIILFSFIMEQFPTSLHQSSYQIYILIEPKVDIASLLTKKRSIHELSFAIIAVTQFKNLHTATFLDYFTGMPTQCSKNFDLFYV